MLLVDPRAGSNELAKDLAALGLEVEKDLLPFGDVAFVSKDGANVGIEFKKLPDLVQSLRDGRLTGHQLPGMQEMYEYSFLLVEGETTINKSGQLLVPTRMKGHYRPLGMPNSELTKRLLTIELLGGIHVSRSRDRAHSIHWISSCYRWFCDKSLTAHTTLQTPHTTPTYAPLSDFRAIVKDRFPSIGLRASKAVEMHFGGSLYRACHAGVEEWASIQIPSNKGTRRLGVKNAQRIVDFVRGI